MADEVDDPFTDPASVPAPTPAPKKKSLFTKSLWNKPVKPADKEGIDFFSRAEEVWPSRIAEEDRRRQRKLEKLERKRSTVSAEKKESSTPDKRRRISKEEPEYHSSEGSGCHDDAEEASWMRSESTLSTPSSRKSHSGSRRKSLASPTSLAGRYSRDLHTKKAQATKSDLRGYISLSDSDEAAKVQENARTGVQPIIVDEDDDDVVAVVPNPVIPIEEDPMSDEEFPELAREARKREQQKALERFKAGNSYQNKNHDSNGSNTSDHNVDDIFQDQPAVPEDPRVEILITSVMEDSTNLIVKRKLSQKLREVRLVWLDKQSISGQPLPESMRMSIFLTWRGKRLFDSTDCTSLRLKIDGSGQIYSDGEGVKDGRIHLEAWTQELFDNTQRRLAAKLKSGESEDEPEPVKEDPVEEIKVTLRAQGRKDVKVKVRPSTPLQKLVNAFRSREGIPDDVEVTLYFDGEKLDPEGKVEDTEIEDMDVVEVHVQ